MNITPTLAEQTLGGEGEGREELLNLRLPIFLRCVCVCVFWAFFLGKCLMFAWGSMASPTKLNVSAKTPTIMSKA